MVEKTDAQHAEDIRGEYGTHFTGDLFTVVFQRYGIAGDAAGTWSVFTVADDDEHGGQRGATVGTMRSGICDLVVNDLERTFGLTRFFWTDLSPEVQRYLEMNCLPFEWHGQMDELSPRIHGIYAKSREDLHRPEQPAWVQAALAGADMDF